MKTSNMILSLWVLVVASLALALVWYLKATDSSGPANTTAGVVELKPVEKKDPVAKPVAKSVRDRPAARPKPSPTFSGRVLDADGKPVAGAVVHLLPPAKPSAPPALPDTTEIRHVVQIVTILDEDWERVRPISAWSAVPSGDPSRAGGPEIGSATSAADGTFSIVLGPGASNGPCRLTTRVEAVGSASDADVYAGRPVDLVLSSGGVVLGSVIAELDGAKVPDARVVFDSGDHEYAAATDEKGAFRIEGMPPGRFSVRAGAAGRTPILEQPVQVLRGEPVVLKLPRGTTLRVKAVYEPEGATAEQVIPNAEIVALEDSAQVYVVGRTNDYGIVEFPGLPAGSWTVNGRAVNFVSQGDVQADFDPNREVAEEKVTFEPAVLTPVEVVDERGAPVAGVEFFSSDGYDVYDSIRAEKLPGATDRDGKFQFPFEFDGPRCRIFGFKKGYGMVEAAPDIYDDGTPLRVVMKSSIRVYGKVLDDKGAVVPDATVRLTIDAKEGAANAGETHTVQIRTDVAGRFDFPYVPDGFDVSLEADSGDAWSDDSPTVEQVEGKSDYEVNLRLEPVAQVRGVAPGGPHPTDFRPVPRDVPVPPVRGENQK